MARQTINMEYEVGKDGRVKPCRGLHGVYCGLPRKKNQTYCADHQSQYQRERYAELRKASGKGYTERVYTRTTEVLICSSCENPKPEGLFVPHGLTMPPICQGCKELFDLLRMEYGMKHAAKVVTFIYNNLESIEASDADTGFEAWFDAKADKYLSQYEWPEGREDYKNHWRQHYTNEYAKLMVDKAVKVEMPKR